MGQWFWRWLCFFVGVLLTAACGQSPSARSETPPPTLLRFTPVTASLPIGSLIRPPMTSTPSGLPALSLIGPTCYETPVQSLVCLGWIHNPLDHAQENILLNLKLVDDNGDVIVSQNMSPVREWLPPQSGAPYRFIFADLPPVPVTPQIGLLTVRPARENTYVSLEVQRITTEWDGKVYRISGQIHNKSPVIVSEVKIVVTVQDAAGSVIGFRTLIQAKPEAFETTLILLEPYAETYRVTITADGIKGE